MGLLSDTKKRRKLGEILKAHYSKVNFLCFFVGLLWFALLPSDLLSNKTYFSENALLPGLVVREFNPGSSINRLLDSFNEEIESHSIVPYAWIQAQFQQIGLDVYTHNFTLQYPFGKKLKYIGNNIYAILRAPKSPGTEALVLSTPYRGFNSVHETTAPSVVLMIELARYFRRYSYWSKDIIFLVTELEMIGYQAWLDAYHEVSTSEFIKSERLAGSSGLIQGVINLEISSEKVSHIDIKVEGLNGQLPNLDLFNLAVELCTREMVITTFQNQVNPYSMSPFDTWKHNLITMLSMMSLQSTGLPTGGHGLFHRFGIQALTLTSKNDHSITTSKVSLIHIGRVLEGIFRSLNNLLEKFHQSFFFYLLPSTKRYVSIGLYMPPFALIVLPALIKALYLFVNLQVSVIKIDDLKIGNYVSLLPALDLIILCHIIGCVFFFSLFYLQDFKYFVELPFEDLLYYTHLVLFVMSFLFIYTYNQKITLTYKDFNAKLCTLLLECSLFLYTLSLINISIATLLSIIYIPVAVLLRVNARFSWLYRILLLLSNPFSVTYIIVVMQSYLTDGTLSWGQHFIRSVTGHKKLILYSVEDMVLFNNWNYKVATLVVLPLWFSFWTLQTSRVKEE